MSVPCVFVCVFVLLEFSPHKGSISVGLGELILACSCEIGCLGLGEGVKIMHTTHIADISHQYAGAADHRWLCLNFFYVGNVRGIQQNLLSRREKLK